MTGFRLRWGAMLAGGCAAALVSLSAASATLQISPVTVEFSAKQNAIGMTLSNPGETPVYGQVRIYAWTQEDGEDKLTPTDAIAASPPILRIDGGSSQIIRLVRVANASPQAEQNFRLLVDELPEPGQPVQSGISIRMRYSIPVFVVPATSPRSPTCASHSSASTASGSWKQITEAARARRSVRPGLSMPPANRTP